MVTANASTGAGAGAFGGLIRPQRANLKSDDMRGRALRDHVGGQLALKHRADEGHLAADGPVSFDAVTSVTSARSSRAASVGAKSRV